MEKRDNNFRAKWVIPFTAVIFSLFLHALLLQIKWDDKEEYSPPSISVRLLNYNINSRPVQKQKSTEKIQSKSNNTKGLAIKLIQDSMSLAKTQAEYLYSVQFNKKLQKNIIMDINTDNNQNKTLIKDYIENNGTVHLKIANSCFSVRESNFLWMFDEPIYEVEECLNKFK